MDSKITHVIFDMDGLILDTESIYFEAYAKVLAEIDPNIKYSYRVHSKILGLSDIDGTKLLFEEYGIDENRQISISEFNGRKKKESDHYLNRAKSLPGIIKLIHHLYKNGVKMAIATSSSSEQFSLKTGKNHRLLLRMINHVVKGDDGELKKSKPAPDIFLLALKRFDEEVDPKNVMVFEDSLNGIKAGKAAGLKTILIPHPDALNKDNNTIVDPDFIIESAHHVNLTHIGLPSFGYRKVTHVIFDMDGLLLDSISIYNKAAFTILNKFGKTPDDEFKLSVLGLKLEEALTAAINFYQLPTTLEKLSEEFKHELVEILCNVPLLPGVSEIINHLYDNGIKISVATSASRTNYEMKTTIHKELFSKFDHIITADDPELTATKPNPDIFLLSASRFPEKPKPTDCLVFEDAVKGIEAACRAHMQCVMIPDSNLEPSQTKLATQLLQSMEQFRPQDFGLPPYTNKE